MVDTALVEPLLIDIVEVVRLLGGVSSRHVYRLADAGKMPKPVKIGNVNRWDRAKFIAWVAEGCKPVRHVAAGT